MLAQIRLPRIVGGIRLRKHRGRGVSSVLWRVAARVFLGLALVSAAVEYLSFQFIQRSVARSDPPSIGRRGIYGPV